MTYFKIVAQQNNFFFNFSSLVKENTAFPLQKSVGNVHLGNTYLLTNSRITRKTHTVSVKSAEFLNIVI